MADMTPEQQIAAFAAAPPAIPEAVRAAARLLLADTLKVGAAGAAGTEARALAKAAAPGACRLFAGGTASVGDAAFANGFAIHCLEWDPVHEAAVVHACSVVTAALLAAFDEGEERNHERLITAFVIGVEIAAGLGLAATGPMKFFRPATAGVIGATLACAHLRGFDERRMLSTLGLAYSFAGGTMQAHAEGSIALPLQIAAAARSAVTATASAGRNLVGPANALTGPFGYAALIEPLDLVRWLPDLGMRWLTEEVSLKPWPCGRASHALLSAIGVAEVDVSDLQSLTAYVPPLVQRLVGRPVQPRMDPPYARLCGPYLAAMMFDEGRIDPRRFRVGEAPEPALLELAERITIDLDSNDDPNALGPQRFLFEDEEGMTDIRLEHAIGSPDAPMSEALAADRDALLAEVAGPSGAAIVADPLGWVERAQ
jgi:2-methylcitrate dehydratase PrpD